MHPANEKMFLVLVRNMKATLDSMEQALIAREDSPAAARKPSVVDETLFTSPEEDEAIARAFGLASEEHDKHLHQVFKELLEDAGMDQA